MSDRETILSAIRRALEIPSPPPHGAVPGAPPREAAADASRCLPASGDSMEEWIERFATNAASLHANFHAVQSDSGCVQILADIARSEGWRRVAAAGDPWICRLATAAGLPVTGVDRTYCRHDLEACDVAITGCDALIAQPGSVLVTSRSTGGRAVSVLPPHHVVLARRGQLVPDLPAAFALLHRTCGAANWPSMISFVTGPSRTADIERILVLGAHGPAKLTILLVSGNGE